MQGFGARHPASVACDVQHKGHGSGASS
jgi:hypothetical protein